MSHAYSTTKRRTRKILAYETPQECFDASLKSLLS